MSVVSELCDFFVLSVVQVCVDYGGVKCVSCVS